MRMPPLCVSIEGMGKKLWIGCAAVLVVQALAAAAEPRWPSLEGGGAYVLFMSADVTVVNGTSRDLARTRGRRTSTKEELFWRVSSRGLPTSGSRRRSSPAGAGNSSACSSRWCSNWKSLGRKQEQAAKDGDVKLNGLVAKALASGAAKLGKSAGAGKRDVSYRFITSAGSPSRA